MSATEWVIQFEPDQGEAVAAFRRAAGAQMLMDEGQVWVRGAGDAIDLETRRKIAPDAKHFRVMGSHLILEGQRVPMREAPQGNWRPLGESLEFVLPEMIGQSPVVSGQWPVKSNAVVKLVRQVFWGDVAPTTVLLPLASFAEYVEMAPEVRLRRWSFVVSSSGDCLVRGEPLPPLPGVFFVERERVAVPLGYGWTPKVDTATLRERAGAIGEELLLWREDGALEVIDLLDFSRVSRAVVRAARERIAHG